MNRSTVLLAWVGTTDLRAPNDEDSVGLGPVAQAVKKRPFDEVVLLSNSPKARIDACVSWLATRASCRAHVEQCELSSPTEFGGIYAAAVGVVQKVPRRHGLDAKLTLHVSRGTPAMAAIWILLAKTRFPAELIESSRQHGLRTVSVPLDITADLLPDLLRRADEGLQRLSQGLPPEAPEFSDILHRGRAMKRAVLLARRVALRAVPVLIEGETGTGKGLLARAFHRSSARRDRPFVAVNCGAIPAELVETELFGHVKGALSGATSSRKGHFVEADGGTLFLDDVGELPKPAQVKLLRVLQGSEVLPVGSSRPRGVDVRVIAATNRPLLSQVTEGRFREDLFHRLATAILQLPPLRERREDLPLLIDYFLNQINRGGRGQPGFVEKKLSAGARSLLLGHPWPGNVRELQNTLLRAAIRTPESILKVDDIREALLPPATSSLDRILDRPLGEGLDLPGLLATVARHYLERALEVAGGNKRRAAKLVGLPSHQTLTDWMRPYGVTS